MRIGYHASHEQFAPSDLLRLVCLAEAAGFQCAMSSDHFHPWSERQGQSGFAWSWLGAALQATSLPFGIITAPGWRYHPAIIAQAAATLAEMFEGRLWVALGSGEAINEAITGEPWPEKAERNARLFECVDIIRGLLAGETVTHRGRITCIEAKLYSLPKRSPDLLGTAVTEETARWAGAWADGLLTVYQPPEHLRRTIAAYREGGGRGRVVVQAAVSWARTDEEALQEAHQQWAANMIGGEVNWDLRRPSDFDLATRFVRPEDVRGSILTSSSLQRHVDWLSEAAEVGVDELQIHVVGKNQDAVIEAYGNDVLPQLR